MIHAVNSFKGEQICTLYFFQPSPDMEKNILLFKEAYNELRNNNMPLLTIDSNKHLLKMEKSEIEAVKTEIKDKLNLYRSQTIFATRQFNEPKTILSPPRLGSRG